MYNSVLHHATMVYKMLKHVYVTHKINVRLDASHVQVLVFAQLVILDFIYQMAHAMFVVLLVYLVHQHRPATNAIIISIYKIT